MVLQRNRALEVDCETQPLSRARTHTLSLSLSHTHTPCEPWKTQVPIRLICLGPVSSADVPSVNLKYRLGDMRVDQDLRVPVTSMRFVVPEPTIPKELFFEQWKTIG